ncbi:hypothetical protein [Acidovorax sp. PRC11]|jgi:hypothetical protein|uniref:hypothetical protein n=1 Tax=Comamonadaceae TaxID=80864 RepID=UPI002881B1C0|nr:hypothetical protein [Acidovorax sp. PRC11]MDT0136969.1 hypothetical protein [Acidovorax sp. PRC11]
MKAAALRSLKSLNMVWLVSIALVDMLVVVALVAPEWLQTESWTRSGMARLAASIAMPALVLLVANLLPHDVKAMLVYWKPLGNLPGSQAFTKHGPSDPRIDMGALKRNVGVLPKDPNEQNAKWYKLYRQVSSETEVMEAHRLFLLYRDMAAVSLLLGMTVPLALLYAGTSAAAVAGTAALFLVQYLATAVSARWSGVRFVCSVLAVHSVKKVTASKAAVAP